MVNMGYVIILKFNIIIHIAYIFNSFMKLIIYTVAEIVL